MVSRETVFQLLSDIPDPEIPVISISDLGILRDVEMTKGSGLNSGADLCTVTITPTYSGCPAMKVIEDQIREVLLANGIEQVKVNMSYAPAWTTDWISDAAKEKLRKYGIAPPEHTSPDKGTLLGGIAKTPACPQCRSVNTEMLSQFGSTACKALYRCKDCKEPFDYFKCI
jgi:ring-1,2-phenylacetyl-CoA epoxidase subunit PaaD